MNAIGKVELILSEMYIFARYLQRRKQKNFGVFLEEFFSIFFSTCRCGLNEGSGNGILQILNTLKAFNDFHYIILWSMLNFEEVWKIDLLGKYMLAYLFFLKQMDLIG